MDWNKYLQHDLVGSFELQPKLLQGLLGDEPGGGRRVHRTFQVLAAGGATVIGYNGLEAEVTLAFGLTEHLLKETLQGISFVND